MIVFSVGSRLRNFVKDLPSFLPFTYPTIVSGSLRGCKTVLDVGCGGGDLSRAMRRKIKLHGVGLDLYLPYVYEARRKNPRDDFVLADARKIPARPGSFDVTLCSQVLEHFEKSEGSRLIECVETISRLRVIVGTPNGPRTPDYSDVQVNRLQKHKSFYVPSELLARGYIVRGQGLNLVYGDKGLVARLPELRLIWILLSYLLSPLTYFVPSIASHIICVKKVEDFDK